MIGSVGSEIFISPELKGKVPNLALAVISATVKVEKHNPNLWREMESLAQQLTTSIKTDGINRVPSIAAMRSAYKALGKDPSRYRESAEALLRRVLSGKGVYQVNSIVDINNLVSLETLCPAGSYDLANVNAPIELRIGCAGESYKGIGKEMINIESLPVLADATGPFGSPTSDSERAMIRLETTRVLMVIFSFQGLEILQPAAVRAQGLLEKYAGATEGSFTLIG